MRRVSVIFLVLSMMISVSTQAVLSREQLDGVAFEAFGNNPVFLVLTTATGSMVAFVGFWYVVPVNPEPSFALELPKIEKQSGLPVNLSEGSFSIPSIQKSYQSIEPLIEQLKTTPELQDGAVLLSADVSTPYAQLMVTMSELEKAGIQVALALEP